MPDERDRPSVTKIILYNLLVFFVAFNLLYWAIPTFGMLSRSYQLARRLIADMPAGVSLLQAPAWIADNWTKTGLPPAVYRSHIGWRRAPWSSQTVHVEGPYLQRRTINTTDSGAKVYFFGGSTMWGDGSPDAGTIASQFAARTGLHAENFGEPGYTAHQNLSLLILLLQAGHRPDLVVFYDGVNEAWVKCRSELTPDSHEREHQFDTVLRQSAVADAFPHYLAPFFTVGANLRRELDRTSRAGDYDCHRDPRKAQAIADRFIQDWQFARALVEWHGGKFIALLQPVIHFSRQPFEHLDSRALIERLRPEYAAVYPLLRERVARAGGDFHDMVAAVDVEEPVYIDWCHLTPRGNAIVAEKIAALVAPLGLRR